MGRIPTAQRAADSILSDSLIAPMAALLVKIGLPLMALGRQDATAPAGLYEFLEPGHAGMSVTGIVCYKRLGLLSQTMSNLDQAMLRIEDALASFLV